MSAATKVHKEEEVKAVELLQEKVKDLGQKREETLEELRSARDFHLNQVSEIDDLLKDMGFASSNGEHQEEEEETETPAPKFVRAGNKVTIRGGVEQLLIKYKDGLSRANVTKLMITEMKYKTGSDADAFANSIYTGGINKLITDGDVFAVGKKPNTIYKHKSNMSPTEIREAKK